MVARNRQSIFEKVQVTTTELSGSSIDFGELAQVISLMTFHPDTAPEPAGWGASAGSGVVYLSRVTEWAAHGAT